VETEHAVKPPAMNGPASPGATGVHNQTEPTQSMQADVTNAYRTPQSQSIIAVDETVPYSRAVDRSELLGSKSPLLVIGVVCVVV